MERDFSGHAPLGSGASAPIPDHDTRMPVSLALCSPGAVVTTTTAVDARQAHVNALVAQCTLLSAQESALIRAERALPARIQQELEPMAPATPDPEVPQTMAPRTFQSASTQTHTQAIHTNWDESTVQV